MAATSGRPIVFNAVTTDERIPDLHRNYQRWLDACRAKGLPVYGQGVTGENGFEFNFTEWNMWDAHEPWRDALLGSPEDRYAKLADPAIRERLKADPPFLFPMETLTLLNTDTASAKQYENHSLGEIAEREGKHTVDALLDVELASVDSPHDLVQRGQLVEVGLPRFDPNQRRLLLALRSDGRED